MVTKLVSWVTTVFSHTNASIDATGNDLYIKVEKQIKFKLKMFKHVNIHKTATIWLYSRVDQFERPLP